MRELTEIEIDFVSGGDGTDSGGDVVVIAPSNGGDYVASGGGGGGYYGPSGQGNRGPAIAGQPHTTPSGHIYQTRMNLNATQTANLDRIVDIGLMNGKSLEEVNAVAAMAFLESSLDNSTINGSHEGLGQYNADEWKQRGETGSIANPGDQVKALYHDYDYYAGTYATAVQNNAFGINDAGVSMLEYFEIKHHEGRNGVDWNRIDPDRGATYRSEIKNAAYLTNIPWTR